jgi:cytosine/adenosine deaminase-related metal-dependent hydrolase
VGATRPVSAGRVLIHCLAAVCGPDDEPIADAAILIEGDTIEAVARYDTLRHSYPLAGKLDATRAVAFPAFVDAHSHARGVPLLRQGIEDAPLEVWLARLTACTPLDLELEAFVAAADLLLTGVTAVGVVFHTFADVDTYKRGVEASVRGLRRAGIRADLALGITDQSEYLPPSVQHANVPQAARHLADPSRQMTPSEYFALVDALTHSDGATGSRDDPMFDGFPVMLAPLAPQWCSPGVWQQVAQRERRGFQVHTHLLESARQRALGPLVSELDMHGVLSGGLSVAHAVWVTGQETQLLARARTSVVHCPGSNERLAGGSAPLRDLLAAGVNVALGFDSHSASEPPDIFVELRLLQSVAERRGTSVTAREAFRIASSNGAHILRCARQMGALRPGSAADVVLLELGEGTRAAHPEYALAHGSRRSVRAVWCAGRQVVRDGRHVLDHEIRSVRQGLAAAIRKDAARRAEALKALAGIEPWLRACWEHATPLSV